MDAAPGPELKEMFDSIILPALKKHNENLAAVGIDPNELYEVSVEELILAFMPTTSSLEKLRKIKQEALVEKLKAAMKYKSAAFVLSKYEEEAEAQGRR